MYDYNKSNSEARIEIRTCLNEYLKGIAREYGVKFETIYTSYSDKQTINFRNRLSNSLIADYIIDWSDVSNIFESADCIVDDFKSKYGSRDVECLYPKQMYPIDTDTYERYRKHMLNSIYGWPKQNPALIRTKIKDVIFNDPATIVFWTDGTKTVVKATDEAFDPEKGLAMAIAKKTFGNKGNYFNNIKPYIEKYYEDEFKIEPGDLVNAFVKADGNVKKGMKRLSKAAKKEKK